MQKILFLIASFIIMHFHASAVLFFVDYNPAGAAPFHDLQSAIDAAPPGQVIYVYKSISYGATAFQQLPDVLPAELNELVLNKTLHIIGMGYFLNENGLLAEPMVSVALNHLVVNAAGSGSTLEGLTIGHLEITDCEVEVDKCRLGRITATGGNGSDFTRNYIDDFNNSPLPTINMLDASDFTFDHNYIHAGLMGTDVLIAATDVESQTVFTNNIFDGGQINISNALFEKNIFLDNTVNVTLNNIYDCNLTTLGINIPLFDIIHNVLNNPMLLLGGLNLGGLNELLIFAPGGLNDLQWLPSPTIPVNMACQLGGEADYAGIYSGSDDQYITCGVTVISLNYPVVETMEIPGSLDQGFPLPSVCETFVLDSIPITHLEYYFDADPGMGLAPQVPLGNMMTGPCFFSPSLPFNDAGLHTLGVRAFNILGRPSEVLSSIFNLQGPQLMAANLTTVEYFIATDVLDGPGTATATFVEDTEVILTEALAVNALPSGVHEIGMRATDENGNFGTTVYRTVLIVDVPGDIVLPNLVMMEFYFDEDPGYQQGELLAIPEPYDLFCSPMTLETLGVNEHEFHKIFYRIWDDEGNFSITQWRWVYVADDGFLIADMDFNGMVNTNDLLLFMAELGCASPPDEVCIADFNNDGVTNSTDLLLFMGYFGLPGESPTE